MKKIELKFQKKVISVLSGEDLSKVWGGVKKIYSLDACETKEECNSVMNCASKQESCQGKCLSDLGGGTDLTGPFESHYTDAVPAEPETCGGCISFGGCTTQDTACEAEEIA